MKRLGLWCMACGALAGAVMASCNLGDDTDRASIVSDDAGGPTRIAGNVTRDYRTKALVTEETTLDEMDEPMVVRFTLGSMERMNAEGKDDWNAVWASGGKAHIASGGLYWSEDLSNQETKLAAADSGMAKKELDASFWKVSDDTPFSMVIDKTWGVKLFKGAQLQTWYLPYTEMDGYGITVGNWTQEFMKALWHDGVTFRTGEYTDYTMKGLSISKCDNKSMRWIASSKYGATCYELDPSGIDRTMMGITTNGGKTPFSAYYIDVKAAQMTTSTAPLIKDAKIVANNPLYGKHLTSGVTISCKVRYQHANTTNGYDAMFGFMPADDSTVHGCAIMEGGALHISDSGNKLNFTPGVSSENGSGKVLLNDTVWHSMAAVFTTDGDDGTTRVAVYHDGKEVLPPTGLVNGSDPAAEPWYPDYFGQTAERVAIGAGFDHTWDAGHVDSGSWISDIKVWDRALNDSELADMAAE